MKTRMFSSRLSKVIIVSASATLAVGISFVYAWTAPPYGGTCSNPPCPPGGNVPAPINVGADSQIKSGSIMVGGLTTVGVGIVGTSLTVGNNLTNQGIFSANQGTPANNFIGGNLILNRADRESVFGTSGNFDLFLYTNSTPKAVLTKDGSFGIGITNPLYSIHAKKDQDATTALIVENKSVTPLAQVLIGAASDSAAGYLEAYSSGFTGTGARQANAAGLIANTVASGGLSIVAGNPSGVMRFYTGGNASTNERMRIDSAGNVGIGTISPSYLLHVKKDQNNSTSIASENKDTGPFARSYVSAIADNALGVLGAFSSTYSGTGQAQPNAVSLFTAGNTSGGLSIASTHTSGVMRFYTGGNASTNERMRIDSAGNVGIGTASPGHKLDVAGDINVSGGCFMVNGTCLTSGTNYWTLANGNLDNNVGTNVRVGGSTASTGGIDVYKGVLGVSAANRFRVDPADDYTKVYQLSVNGLTTGGVFNSTKNAFITNAGEGYFAGNVGIGTASPQRKLHVSQDNAAEIILEQSNGPADSRKWNFLVDGGTDTVAPSFSIRQLNYQTTAGTNRLFINGTNGNVGIGMAPADWIKLQTPMEDRGGYLESRVRFGNMYINSQDPVPVQLPNVHVGSIGINVWYPRRADTDSTSGTGTGIKFMWGGIRFFADNGTGNTDGLYWNSNTNDVSSIRNLYADSFFYNSDESLKKNIHTIPNALDAILKLRGVAFDWKKDGAASLGVIAQEVEKVYPELVKTDAATGLKSVEYGSLVGPIIEAIKELAGKIESLFAHDSSQDETISALQAQVLSQQKAIDELQNEIRDLKNK